MCKCLQTFECDESRRIVELLESRRMPETDSEKSYNVFIEVGCKRNETFCLHKEMMDHFDEIAAIAIALAERLSGEDAYCQLFSATEKFSTASIFK